jgi:hypothetical protein
MARIVLTASYGLQQRLFGVQADELDAQAKIAVLLCGEVVLSYSAILDSPMTYGLVQAAVAALEGGLISVDRREGFGSYRDLVVDNPSKLGTAHADEAVTFLDAKVARVVAFQNVDLSRRLAENVKNLVYLIERSRLGGSASNGLTVLLSEIDRQGGISLEWALERISALELSGESADCANLLYHFLGALSVGASPSWPDRFNTVLKNLRKWQAAFVNAPSVPTVEKETQKRFCLPDQEQYLELIAETRRKSINVDFDELPDALSLDRELITRLPWPEIVRLAQSTEARGVQDLVSQYQTGVDPQGALIVSPELLNGRVVTAIGNLAEVIRSEAVPRVKASRMWKRGLATVTAGSLVAAGAGFVVAPAVGAVLAVGGLCVGIGQVLAEKYASYRYNRVSALGEKLALAQHQDA